MRSAVVSVLYFSLAFSGTATQTDWSGGGGVQGPVSNWGDIFWDANANVVYNSGKLQLNGPMLPEMHIIDDYFDGAVSVYSTDVDGDGDYDVLGAAFNGDDIRWWENINGAGTSWVEHNVDGNFDGAMSVYSSDVDGDGDADVLGAAWYASDITWWENSDGTGTAWTEHNIDGNFNFPCSIHSTDVDGDGDSDVLGASELGCITWWENSDGTGTTWAEHTVDGNFDGAMSVYSTDVDSDGDVDVLGAGDYAITWWENTDGTGTAWTEHAIDGNFNCACSVYSSDVDGDGDADVLGAAVLASAIKWWENTDGIGTTWIEHSVSGNFSGARSVYSTDLDGDGDADVLGAAEYANDITWWENENGTGTSWLEHTVYAYFNGAKSVYAADIDGDGCTDILGASLHYDDIAWWDVTQLSSLGALESSILDAGDVGEWNIFLSSSQEPAGTSVNFQFRSSDDSSNMGAWSDTVFSPETPLEGILTDSTRYLQYKVILETSEPGVSPELAEVAFVFTHVAIVENEFGEVHSWSLHASENPSHGFFSALVSVQETGLVELSLYDVSGRVIAETSQELLTGTHSVNFTGLAEGVYFCTMRAGEFSVRERIVVLD
ncbi:MAG: T9SS type A sorting domain-containing protein [Candidatus Fermentibacteraceae bacterium]|nr:T9SS type A sorting domain-containing protein [Candidatus Fermentibacteraceae bacterium]